MSIEENREERKSVLDLPEGEDFDIVASGVGGKNGEVSVLSWKHHLVLLLCLILTALIAFGAGRLAFYEDFEEPVEIISGKPISSAVSSMPGSTPRKASAESAVSSASMLGAQSASGAVVASKNSDKYHYPWCSGAKRIAEANKRSFASIEDARAAGLTPASNCPGLK